VKKALIVSRDPDQFISVEKSERQKGIVNMDMKINPLNGKGSFR
jgi:hypothetical protein